MTKIEALQKTIFNLENNVYEYKWTSSDSCNCGILSRTILGKSLYETDYYRNINCPMDNIGTFSESAKCLKTGLKMGEVFMALRDCGFTFQEIHELEHLSNPIIADLLGFDLREESTQSGEKFFVSHERTEKASVILYLKEWVKMLQAPTVTLTAYQPAIKEPVAQFVTYSKIVENLPVNAN